MKLQYKKEELFYTRIELLNFKITLQLAYIRHGQFKVSRKWLNVFRWYSG